MTYEIISCPDEKTPSATLWGTFVGDQEKMFLFVSYLLNTTHPEEFWIVERAPDKPARAVRLTTFAEYYHITKNDIKEA